MKKTQKNSLPKKTEGVKKNTTQKNTAKGTTSQAGVKSQKHMPSTISRWQERDLTKHKNNSLLQSGWQWLKAHTIHFAYRGSGIMLTLFVLLLYKGVLLYMLGFVDVSSFFSTIRRYVERLGNELLFVFLVWLFVLLGMRVKSKIIKTIFVSVAFILLAFFVADIFALKHFNSRFVLSLFLFFTPGNAFAYIWLGFRTTIAFLLFLYGCVYVLSRVLARKFFSEKWIISFVRRFVIGLGIFIGISFLFGKTSAYQQNVLQIQYKSDRRVMGENEKSYEQHFIPFSGKNRRPNIIMVFVESFSSIDSLSMGGNRGLLSGFDAIAEKGTVYPNFVANGCASDSSHIAVLQGVEPWEITQLPQNYLRYKSYTLSLPAFFHQNGYQTTFLSTASLGFLQQKDFLTSLQFDTIVGNEAFKNWKKYAFNAAPDEALYKKAIEVLQKTEKDQQQFLVMQTISSHKPYNTPLGNTEEKAFLYADEQLYKFYTSLEEINYFDNGILVVVGDHRKMQSMSYEEIQKRGNAAYGKTVLAVVGKDIPAGGVYTNTLQHLDIFYSLKNLVASGSVSLHEYYNDMFGDYVGRDNAIRYCQYVDRQYIGTRADNSTWVILPSEKSKEASYVRSYYAFEGNRASGVSITGSTLSSMSSSFSYSMEEGSGSDGSGFLSGVQAKRTFVQKKYPDIVRIAHQGNHSVNPANSLAAATSAKNQGAEALEIDVSFTKDGYPVVLHGPDIGRTKCVGENSVGKKYIVEFTLQEMQDNCRLYNEQPIVTIQEMLSKTQDMFSHYFIDIKIYNPQEISYVSMMLDSVKKLGLDKKVIFSSTDMNVNIELIKTQGIGAGWEIGDVSYLPEILETKQEYVMLPYDIVTEQVVKQVKRVGKKPVVFTLQDNATMEKLYNWGVRYFISDNVETLVGE